MTVSTRPLSDSAQRAHEIALWAWGLMLLVLPFSTALALLFSAMGAVFSVLGLRWKLILQTLSSPVVLLALALFAWLMLSAFWSVAPKDELLEGALKYRKLVFVFLVAASIIACQKRPEFLINFFLVGCGVVALGSLMSRFGTLEMILGPSPLREGGWPIGGSMDKYWLRVGGPDNPTFGRNHISQGFFLALASIIALSRALLEIRNNGLNRKALLLYGLILLYASSVFSLQGRTGYVLTAIGLAIAFIDLLRDSEAIFKRRLLAVLPALCIGGLVITSSVNFVPRTQAALDGDQSTRIHFWAEGFRIWSASPIWGHGVGSYAEEYAKNIKNDPWLRANRSHPHSEFVNIAVQTGGVGLVLLVALFFYALKLDKGKSIRPYDELQGAAILFIIGLSFNSVIWDFAEGHFFSVLVALCTYRSVYGNVLCNPTIEKICEIKAERGPR